jgi:hypothetical protein
MAMLPHETDLESLVATLKGDYSSLSARLRQVQHTVSCECSGVTLRLHFPAFRQGKATIHELVDAISIYLTPFALPRKQIADLDEKYQHLPPAEFRAETTKLNQEACDLFIKAEKATGRNGECGELLLYLLTEWILEAPQIIAKLALKTNPKMPVHGADGVHAKYCHKTQRLYLYWGEAKLHASVSGAISDAALSIGKMLSPEETKHELALVKRNIDFAGLDEYAKVEFLQFLNPMNENYNKRFDVVTCLVGFNFDGYDQVGTPDAENAESRFAKLAESELTTLAPTIAAKLKSQGLDSATVELFLLPLPNVQTLRDIFQAKIGWPK